MNATGYKQNSHNQKAPLAKAPFTPVNASAASSGGGSYQTQAGRTHGGSGGQQQQQQAPPNQRAGQVYMSQPQVAAVLTHQPPPAPPPAASTQSQNSQPGQNTSGSRGIPPPPQPPQQNYAQSSGSNQPNAQTYIAHQQQSNYTNPAVASGENMHPYPSSRHIYHPNTFYPPPYFLPNQNHPAIHFDAQSAYLNQPPQPMFQQFIYPPNAQWIPHAPIPAPQTHLHRPPNSQSTGSAPTPAPPQSVPGPNPVQSTPAQPPQAAVDYMMPTMAPQIYPNYSTQQQPSYQKREKKPLLIVDPNTKKAINQPSTQQQPTQANTQALNKSESTKTDKQKDTVVVTVLEDKKMDLTNSSTISTSNNSITNQANVPATAVNTTTTTSSNKTNSNVVVNSPNVLTSASDDFQTQIIRKLKDQQQSAVAVDENETVNSGGVSKPVTVSSKQVTVSVPQSVNASVSVPVAAPIVDDTKSQTEAKTMTTTPSVKPEKTKQAQVNVTETVKKKKRYDREFLLSFREKDVCKQIPEHLKDLDVFRDLRQKPGSQQQQGYYGRSSHGQDQSYGGKGSMSKGRSQKVGSMNKYPRGSMEGRPSHADRDVVLNRVENPYTVKKPSSELEELLREVRIILNRLTPQNFQKLCGDLRTLPINTEERLNESINIIFEKSLDEQIFSQTYAELCKELRTIKVPLESDPTRIITFRTMLLTKCQREFDSDYIQTVNYESLLSEAEAQNDEVKRAEMKELAEEKLRKAKRRSLGNIRFIGELFKLDMLTEGIMNDCIERLLKQETDEENLECLCKLLTTIGKELDRQNASKDQQNNSQRMKHYFDKLDKIARKKDVISARIRFMIMDVIDLRKNNWVPRRKDTGPRRIDDIRREADEEKLRLESEKARQQTHGRQRGNYAQQSQQQHQQHSGQSKSMSMDSSVKTQNGSMASKIKDVKQITHRNNNDLTLGPGGSSGYTWGKQKPTQSTETGSASGIPQSASFSAQKRVNEPISRASLDSKAAKDRLQAVKRMDSGDYSRSDSSQPSSRDSSLSRPAKKVVYTEDEIERKSVSLVNELVENKNISESLKDLEEFCPLNGEQYSEFVEKMIMITMEKNKLSRTLLGEFFLTALKEKKLDINRFEQGLKRVVEIAEDMSIDIPKISIYLGELIAPLFNEHFSLSFLKLALEPVRELKISAEIIAEALKLASDRLGHSTVSTIFKTSNLELNDFLGGVDDNNQFIVQNKLEWLNGQNCDKNQSNLSFDAYETTLNQILAPNRENSAIFDEIEAKFQNRNSKPFIRALVIAVCSSCYSGKIDPDLFKKRSHILKRYICENEDLELEALFAVQALDHRLQHQPGYIRVIFDLLYDEDLIREEVYFRWKNEDKEEGHKISVLSLKQFFEWLSDPDNENLDAGNENR